jgi:hypothetical protein
MRRKLKPQTLGTQVTKFVEKIKFNNVTVIFLKKKWNKINFHE